MTKRYTGGKEPHTSSICCIFISTNIAACMSLGTDKRRLKSVQNGHGALEKSYSSMKHTACETGLITKAGVVLVHSFK